MAASSSTRLLALHGLRLKGIAELDLLAEVIDVPAEELSSELEVLADTDLVVYRYGRMPGYQLTPEGKVMGRRLLEEELASTGVGPAIEAAYADFLGINHQLLGICTAWQLREVDGVPVANDHSDAGYDAGVRARLVDLHDRVEPVLDALGDALHRFRGHQRRLRFALDRVGAGEVDYFTKPMFPSYHTTWFELHEDLLATLGRERSREGSDPLADDRSS